MSIDNSVNDLLSGGSATAKFPTIGTTHKGTVVSAVTRQQTDYASKEPKFWKDGNPMMEVVITLQTDERDDDDPNDDGKRTLYASGAMLKAIRAALTAAGEQLAEHGTLAVKYSSDGTPSQPGFNPPKQYTAEYKAPAPVSVESLL